MKKTEEHGKITNIPEEDLQEIKRIVSGRKFCKRGRRLQDIVNEELARYEYENNAVITRSHGELIVRADWAITTFLTFKSIEIAREFLTNFRELIEQAGDLI